MSMLFVARNIPIPCHRENDIVLQLVKQLEKRGEKISVVFPAEFLPIPRQWLTGARRAIKDLQASFVVSGVSVVVVRYIRLPTFTFSYLLSGFFWPIKSLKPTDIVHAHYLLPDGWMAKKLSRRWGCKFAVTVRQGDMFKMSKLHDLAPVKVMYRKVLKHADYVFSPSLNVIDKLQSEGIEAHFLPHGVDDVPNVSSVPSKSERIRVLVVASLLSGKRVDWVLRAVHEYSGHKDTELVVVGDGECMEDLQAMAQRYDLPVRFTGQVTRDVVFQEMDEADIMALPSARETFGLVYLEAALRNCAVVATRGTGVDGCFVDNTEMVFTDSNFSDFCTCLWGLIDDDGFRCHVAEQGRIRTRKDYLWGSVLDRYLKLTNAT